MSFWFCHLLRDMRSKKRPSIGTPFGLKCANGKLRHVLIALKAIFVAFDLFLVQFVGGVANGVFGLANHVASLAFSLFRHALGLGFLIACPLANLPLNASGNVFCFSFNAFLVHKSPFLFSCSCSLMSHGKARQKLTCPSVSCNVSEESFGFKCLLICLK